MNRCFPEKHKCLLSWSQDDDDEPLAAHYKVLWELVEAGWKANILSWILLYSTGFKLKTSCTLGECSTLHHDGGDGWWHIYWYIQIQTPDIYIVYRKTIKELPMIPLYTHSRWYQTMQQWISLAQPQCVWFYFRHQ